MRVIYGANGSPFVLARPSFKRVIEEEASFLGTTP